jgi:hypothetical protein
MNSTSGSNPTICNLIEVENDIIEVRYAFAFDLLGTISN